MKPLKFRMDKEAKKANAEAKKRARALEKAEKAYERELKKVFSEKHSVSFGHIYFDERLRDLEAELKRDDIFKKEDECAKLHITTFSTSKYAKVEVKREIPIEPAGETDTMLTRQMMEQEFYVVRRNQVSEFVNQDLHQRDSFIIESGDAAAPIKAMWAARVQDSSLNYETGHFFETSPNRPLTEVICTSIKSILKRPAALQKDVGEITNKVRVQAPGADVEQLWLRMLLTIDGITEAELETVKGIIPRYAALAFNQAK